MGRKPVADGAHATRVVRCHAGGAGSGGGNGGAGEEEVEGEAQVMPSAEQTVTVKRMFIGLTSWSRLRQWSNTLQANEYVPGCCASQLDAIAPEPSGERVCARVTLPSKSQSSAAAAEAMSETLCAPAGLAAVLPGAAAKRNWTVVPTLTVRGWKPESGFPTRPQ